MKINRPSYRLLISPDESFLVNVGREVILFTIGDTSLNELKRFNALRNPSFCALSSNSKMVAYHSTRGHIAVHDIKTGNLLAKSKCLSKEGYGLYFINNDTQIISSVCQGSVFVLDIESGKVSILNNFPVHHATNIVPIPDNNFIAIGSMPDEGTLAYGFSIEQDTRTFTDLFSSYPYLLESVTFIYSGNEILFFGSPIKNNSDEWCNGSILEYFLFSYNLSTNIFCSIFKIQDLLGIDGRVHLDYGYFTSMCLSKSKQYLLIGFSKSIIIIDLLNNKHINTVRAMYVSSLHFVKSDTEVVIATWERIQFVDFQKLCKMCES